MPIRELTGRDERVNKQTVERESIMFRTNNNQNRQVMTADELFRVAPSIFAEAPKQGMSDRYAFIPTTRVLELLQGQGWQPVYAGQSRARTAEGRDFMRHVVRFQNENKALANVGDSRPELVLTNSHNGTSAFQLMLGIFRLVCSNGLVVCDSQMDKVSIKHVGFQDENVIDASYRIIHDVPRIAGRIDEFRSVQLATAEQLALAEAAITVRWGEEKAPITARDLLQPRRSIDGNNDIWATMNTVQENLIRGGLRGHSHNADTGRTRRTSTRAVQSVSEDIRINKALWTLAERMRELKAS